MASKPRASSLIDSGSDVLEEGWRCTSVPGHADQKILKTRHLVKELSTSTELSTSDSASAVRHVAYLTDKS